MLKEELETNSSLSRLNKVCKGISFALKAVFALICLFWIFATLSMVRFLDSGYLSLLSILFHIARGASMIVLFIVLMGVFSDAAKGSSPFTMKQTSRLRIISVMLIIYGVLELLLSAYTTFIDLEGISTGYISTGYTPVFSFNFSPFVAAAVIYAFSFVFKYGVLLQEFSDETL